METVLMKRIRLRGSEIKFIICAELSGTNCYAELSAPNCPGTQDLYAQDWKLNV